ncbi:TPA: amylovoran biosynthesis protein AmsE, partial [Escherichia coli]|nr:amylovoran biosynthesis protein AmsE [Escherichia coli]
MFSVLMSLYDKEKPEYLDQCLNSLSRQTLLA